MAAEERQWQYLTPAGDKRVRLGWLVCVWMALAGGGKLLRSLLHRRVSHTRARDFHAPLHKCITKPTGPVPRVDADAHAGEAAAGAGFVLLLLVRRRVGTACRV